MNGIAACLRLMGCDNLALLGWGSRGLARRKEKAWLHIFVLFSSLWLKYLELWSSNCKATVTHNKFSTLSRLLLPFCGTTHSRPQRPRSFWSAPRIATSGLNLWPGPTPEVRDSRTSRHSAHAQNQVWQIWLVLVSIYCVYKVKTGMSLSRARGRDFWCWPKETRPLGTRMRDNLSRNSCVTHARVNALACVSHRLFPCTNGLIGPVDTLRTHQVRLHLYSLLDS